MRWRGWFYCVLLFVLLGGSASQAAEFWPYHSPYHWVYDIPADATGTGEVSDVAVDAEGTVHVVYYNAVEETFVYARRREGLGWERENVHGDAIPDYYHKSVSIDLDDAGVPHIALTHSGDPWVHVYSRITGGWSQDYIYRPEEHSGRQVLLEWMDGEGPRVLVLDYYRTGTQPDIDREYHIYYYHKVPGYWQGVLLGLDSDITDPPDLGSKLGFTTDSNGINYFSHFWDGDLVVKKFTATGQIIAADSLPLTGDCGYWHSIGVDSGGWVHVAYSRPDLDGVSTDLYFVHGDFNFWSSPELVFAQQGWDITDVNLAMDNDDLPVVAFLFAKTPRIGWNAYNSTTLLKVFRHDETWSVVGEYYVSGNGFGLALDDAGLPHVTYQHRGILHLGSMEPRFDTDLIALLVNDYAHIDFATVNWDSLAVEDDAYDYGDSGNNGNHYGQGSFESPDGNPHNQGWYAYDLSDTGVGSFGQLWDDIYGWDEPYFLHNPTARWAFVNDGLVEPGLDPAWCPNWCYGPGGYVLETDGGWAGPGNYLHNEIRSPAIPFTSEVAGAQLRFEAYLHEPLANDSPGMFLTWRVRSTASTDSLGLESATWHSHNEALAGGPWTGKIARDISTLLVPGARWVQVGIGVMQLGPDAWLDGDNATPAPYIDNVGVVVNRTNWRPAMLANPAFLAQDAFPRGGALGFTDLVNNSVPFDMAHAFSLAKGGAPGDSTLLSVQILDESAEIMGTPVMVYRVMPNPLFDPYRTSGQALTGEVPMTRVTAEQAKSTGWNTETMWLADLPDEGFLFPGDMMHYYYRAEDNLGRIATLPADTAGFGYFPQDDSYDPFGYPPEFSFRALPSLLSSTPGDQPEILLWFDRELEGAHAVWKTALANLGMMEGKDFDLYTTNSPGSGLGNGLNRVSPEQLAYYRTIIYTAGHHSRYTLAMVEAGDSGNDVAVLDQWLRLGGKNLLLIGDNVASELGASTTNGAGFLADWVGVEAVSSEATPQFYTLTPEVQVTAGNPVFTSVDRWYIDSIAQHKTIDEVVCLPSAVRLAEFLRVDGTPGLYDMAAVSLNQVMDFDADVMLVPYSFSDIGTDSEDTGLAARTRMLSDILMYLAFGGGALPPSDVPAADRFTSRAYPNPFNPTLTVSYHLPDRSRLTAEVFDVKGRRVAVLADELREKGDGEITWQGTDSQGRDLGSGTYFVRLQAAGESAVHRVALVK